MEPPVKGEVQTPRTDAEHERLLSFEHESAVIGWEASFLCMTDLARQLERELAELKENTVGVTAAWKRDYDGEKERGDLWMADCKAAEERNAQLVADRKMLMAELERLCVEIPKQLGSNVPMKNALLSSLKSRP